MTHRSKTRLLVSKAELAIAALLGSLASAPCHAHAEWAFGEFAGVAQQPIALLVTAKVGERECRFQLDTGHNDAVIWHGEGSSKSEVEVVVSFGGVTRKARTRADFAARVAACTSRDTVGTLGNGFFDAGTLVVDLKTPEVRYVSGSLLAARTDAHPMFYARWTAQGGHPLVELRRGSADGRVEYALLDTGSAAFTLNLQTAADWQAFTGGAALKPGGQVKRFTVNAWGAKRTCFAAPAGGFRVGALNVGAEPVHHCPDLGFKPPIQFLGVLGMKPFLNSVLTIDYRAGRWAVDRP